MKFLLTNDDGIEAPGLAMLQQALSRLGQVVIVAPTEPLSGCSPGVRLAPIIAAASLVDMGFRNSAGQTTLTSKDDSHVDA